MSFKQNNGILTCVLAGTSGSIIVLLVIGVIGMVWWDPIFVNLMQSSEHMCEAHMEGYYCFFSQNWDDGTYLSSITGFYTNLITVLLALMAIMSALSFVVIRSSAKGHIEDYVDNVIEQPHMKHMFDEQISNAVTKNIDYGELSSRVDEIERILEDEIGSKVSGTLTKE